MISRSSPRSAGAFEARRRRRISSGVRHRHARDPIVRGVAIIGALVLAGGCADDSPATPAAPPAAGEPIEVAAPVGTIDDSSVLDVRWALLDYRTSEGATVPAAFDPPYTLTLSTAEDEVFPLSVTFPTCGGLEGDYRLAGTRLAVLDVRDYRDELDCGPPSPGMPARTLSSSSCSSAPERSRRSWRTTS